MEEAVIEQVYQSLSTSDQTRRVVGVFDVEMTKLSAQRQLRLVTPVFLGGNYIPGSVRRALATGTVMAHDAKTEVSLHIDEENFRVLLTYQTDWPNGSRDAFMALFEDFIVLADEWRRLLDEYGEQDLVYVPVK